MTWLAVASRLRLHRASLLSTVACADLSSRYALLVPEPSVFSPPSQGPEKEPLAETVCSRLPDQVLFFQSSRRILLFLRLQRLWPLRHRGAKVIPGCGSENRLRQRHSPLLMTQSENLGRRAVNWRSVLCRLLQSFTVHRRGVGQETRDCRAHGDTRRGQVAAGRIQFHEKGARSLCEPDRGFRIHQMIFGRNNNQELRVYLGRSLFERRYAQLRRNI